MHRERERELCNAERTKAYLGAKSNLPPFSIVMAGAVINNCKLPAEHRPDWAGTGRSTHAQRMILYPKSISRGSEREWGRGSAPPSIFPSSVPSFELQFPSFCVENAPTSSLAFVRPFVRCHYHKSQSWRNMSWREGKRDGRRESEGGKNGEVAA